MLPGKSMKPKYDFRKIHILHNDLLIDECCGSTRGLINNVAFLQDNLLVQGDVVQEVDKDHQKTPLWAFPWNPHCSVWIHLVWGTHSHLGDLEKDCLSGRIVTGQGSNGFKLKEGRFKSDVGKKFWIMRVVKHGNWLPSKALCAPSLTVFKAEWGFEQPCLVESVPTHGSGLGTRWSLKILYKPRHSMFLG